MGRPNLDFSSRYIPVTESGCWLWIGGVDADGYGQTTGSVKAHRLSYELNVGEIPDGMKVCHRCDVRLCVRPSHLFLGTPKDNSLDMVSKARQAKGTGVHTAKIVEADVLEILAADEPCYVTAARFGLSDAAVSQIKLGRTWKHVPRPVGYSYVPKRRVYS